MRSKRILLALSLSLTAWSEPELTSVEHVDLSRYMGRWYEIARLPNSFETHCAESYADYALKADNTVSVLNTCIKENGRVRTAKGTARIADRASNSKLEVNFVPKWIRWLGVGWGDYWIIELGKKYDYAVVSEPSKRYLWILSRTPTMDPAKRELILKKLESWEFDLSHLIVNEIPKT